MTIDSFILLQMVIASVVAVGLYTIIGIIPGTDETSVLVPVTAVLFVLGIEPVVILTFFIASIVALNLTDSIPTALTSIPGGVMSTPLVESSQHLKSRGLTTSSIRKMTMGSVIGTLVAIPMALIIILIVKLITTHTSFDLENFVKSYTGQIFFIGAIVLSLLSKKKIISLISVIPFALLIALAKHIHPISNTPFFLSITSGPLVASLFLLIIPKYHKASIVKGNQDIEIEIDSDEKINLLTIVTPDEIKRSVISSILASLTFFLSPVGMTLLIGESVNNNIEDKDRRAQSKVTSMNAVANAAYLAGIMISLLAFKIPISPAAIGPGAKLFEVGSPILDLSFNTALVAIIVGAVIALIITAYLSLKYASKMTNLVFRYVSQEAVLILLLTLVTLLVYLDAGFIGIISILIVSFISGLLNKVGVTYGVQFMALYASPFIVSLLGL
ncbi:MAG TPA: tripartite tricarboxylate transporter permease [Acholeplasmataceae bacterium]|nr:tripartite tricarboxylate transporter permease [Acholeplasmataceae bacterium]